MLPEESCALSQVATPEATGLCSCLALPPLPHGSFQLAGGGGTSLSNFRAAALAARGQIGYSFPWPEHWLSWARLGRCIQTASSGCGLIFRAPRPPPQMGSKAPSAPGPCGLFHLRSTRGRQGCPCRQAALQRCSGLLFPSSSWAQKVTPRTQSSQGCHLQGLPGLWLVLSLCDGILGLPEVGHTLLILWKRNCI